MLRRGGLETQYSMQNPGDAGSWISLAGLFNQPAEYKDQPVNHKDSSESTTSQILTFFKECFAKKQLL